MLIASAVMTTICAIAEEGYGRMKERGDTYGDRSKVRERMLKIPGDSSQVLKGPT